jgi:hypothetical protein
LALALTLYTLGVRAQYSDRYTLVSAGACRGNGGSSDKVNGMYAQGLSQRECEQECDNDATCIGYAFQVSKAGASDAWCLIHGPGIAGSCSDAGADTQAKCSALGSCSDASVACAGGDCLGRDELCANVEGTWTSAGATWVGPDDPWTGDSHATTHIHDGNGNADYSCFDIDVNDHVGRCDGPGSCAADFAAADTYAEADCDVAGGCTYAAAPVMEKVVVPHVPDELDMDDVYAPAMSGACRGTDANGAQVGANSKYANSCDIDGKKKACGEEGQDACSMTQAECEAGCAAENAASPGACVAYHHGPWCSVFGHHVETGVGIADENPCWFANPYDAKDVTGTNTNIQYLCWTTLPAEEEHDEHAGHDDHGDESEDADEHDGHDHGDESEDAGEAEDESDGAATRVLTAAGALLAAAVVAAV